MCVCVCVCVVGPTDRSVVHVFDHDTRRVLQSPSVLPAFVFSCGSGILAA